ncbi:hypothetical protein BURK2_00099 [Burkholderiales bacterium]|nr:MAG: GNAT family N-acetyltransferase [Burkholderiales bacterium]CAG0949383.1 hypothetical protein BURK2_00099 [Burkholderiales bacterium]
MKIVRAGPADAETLARFFGEAFVADPLMSYFFHDSPLGQARATEAFFCLLARARLALNMPVLVASRGGEILAAAMGYDTTRPQWPEGLEAEWQSMIDNTPGLARRFADYDLVSDPRVPTQPHYYLGVIGVAAAGRGAGLGGALLEAFCADSERDARSAGVYLETATPQNIGFYQAHGFELRGVGDLGSGQLWCFYRPQGRTSHEVLRRTIVPG